MKARERQQGASLLVVLILLTVLAMASLALARVTNTSTQIAGNLAFKSAAMQASEAGMSEAFVQLQALASTDLDATKGAWYFPSSQTLDSTGLPVTAAWSSAPQVAIAGGYSVSYVVERLCTGSLPVSDVANQCFVKRLPSGGSAKANSESIDAPAVVQYRMTVYVQGPKGTQTFVQSLATRPA